MSTRTWIIAISALAITGGAAALAQSVSKPEQDKGAGADRPTAAGPGHHGYGYGGPDHFRGDDFRGPRHWRHRHMRRGWGRRWRWRSISKSDFESRSRGRFARIDANGDNVLDAKEIETWISRRGANRAKRIGLRMIRRVDTNRDGKVVREELEQRLKDRFARIDLNNDGKITEDDLPPIMRGMDVLTNRGGVRPMRGRGWRKRRAHRWGMHRGRRMRRGRRIIMRLRQADANRDGTITFAEFAKRPRQRFNMLDRNQDGTVDTADFDQLRKAMIEYRVRRFIHKFGPTADSSRRVTREQFMKRAQDRFARRDLNGDGRIDRTDRALRRGWDGQQRRP